MIADLKPYPAYRQADGGWLGEVPSHWTIRRMKYVVREIDSRSTTGKEQLLRISQYTGVTQRRRADGVEEPDTRADSLVGYKRVEPDDLVINIMLAWNGSMGVSRYEGIASPAYCVYRFGRSLRPWYFHNLLRSPAYKARIKASSTGVVESRLRLYSDDLGRIEAMVPPSDEQAAIVRFLDWANGQLERAIRAKRNVIALLNEQKQAIVHRAVTRGLDPSVPLKTSRVPWLGEVPNHWSMVPVRRLAARGRSSIVNGPFGSDLLTTELVLQGVPVVYIRDVSSGQYRRKSRSHVSPAKAEAISFCQVLPGDVLIAKVGDPPGTAAEYPQGEPAAVVTQDVIRLRPNRHIVLPEYLVRLLNSSAGRTAIAPICVESTRGRFSLPDFRGLAVELPPVEEQERILDAVRSLERPVVVAASRLEREIELLREYRTRLVADVVTGKLDVLEAAAVLSDEGPLDRVEDDAELGDETEFLDEGAPV